MILREYINYKALRINHVAKQLGISRSYVYDLINYKHYPSRKLALRIEEWSKGEITVMESIFPWNSYSDYL